MGALASHNHGDLQWETAWVGKICGYFGLDSLHDYQRRAIASLLRGVYVFLSVKTGGGKSLCYQALPVANVTQRKHVHVLIVSPLLAIMEEQVKQLKLKGFTAAYIGRDSEENAAIKRGEFQFLFATPESLVRDEEWRKLLLAMHTWWCCGKTRSIFYARYDWLTMKSSLCVILMNIKSPTKQKTNDLPWD